MISENHFLQVIKSRIRHRHTPFCAQWPARFTWLFPSIDPEPRIIIKSDKLLCEIMKTSPLDGSHQSPGTPVMRVPLAASVYKTPNIIGVSIHHSLTIIILWVLLAGYCSRDKPAAGKRIKILACHSIDKSWPFDSHRAKLLVFSPLLLLGVSVPRS
jgi:hypothetical protein